MNRLHKIIDPKIVFLLISLPFIVICPMTVGSIITGFPFTSWANNNQAQDYESFFDSIELPEGSRQVGKSKTKISNFYKEPEQEEVDTLGRISQDESIKNACDLLSAKIIFSTVEQEELSAAIVNDYSTKLNVEDSKDKPKAFDIVFPTKLTLLPINLAEEIKFETEVLNLKKDFGVKSYSLNEGEASYILFMYNNDAFESKDFRCQD